MTRDFTLNELIEMIERYARETPIDPEKIGLVAKLILYRQAELAAVAKRREFNPDDTTKES